jgi:hypothetical protein
MRTAIYGSMDRRNYLPRWEIQDFVKNEKGGSFVDDATLEGVGKTSVSVCVFREMEYGPSNGGGCGEGPVCGDSRAILKNADPSTFKYNSIGGRDVPAFRRESLRWPCPGSHSVSAPSHGMCSFGLMRWFTSSLNDKAVNRGSEVQISGAGRMIAWSPPGSCATGLKPAGAGRDCP